VTVIKCVLTTWLDSTNPTDGLQITPTFNAPLGVGDWESLGDDLLDAWNPWMGVDVQGTQQRVVLYDIQGAKPNYPKYQATRFPDIAKPSPNNRDIALCLTGYNEHNRPRYRGRLYIPTCITGHSVTASVASGQMRTKIADLVPIFTNLGGPDIDWGVYSRKDSQFRKYTHWYIDDSWDTQRRRGRKSTARTSGTTSE